jgi:hypothetical protein
MEAVLLLAVSIGSFILGIQWALYVHRPKPKPRSFIIMPTIVVDATKPLVIKNPVVKTLKDSEGSPIPLPAPLPVSGFNVTIENAQGDFGSIRTNDEGNFVFDPGTEIEGEATGELVYTGTVEHEGNTLTATGRQTIELQPGAASSVGDIEPELEVQS